MIPAKIKFLFIVFLTLALLTLAAPTFAAGWVENTIGGPLIPTACTGDQGGKDVNSCGLNEIFQTIINFSKLLFALTGSAALLMFAYGGTMWIIAAGNQERVQKGKEAMKAAIIGLILILGSYLIVNTVIWALSGGEIGKIGKDATIFGNIWSQQQPTVK